jgi:hypothetical protein
MMVELSPFHLLLLLALLALIVVISIVNVAGHVRYEGD